MKQPVCYEDNLDAPITPEQRACVEAWFTRVVCDPSMLVTIYSARVPQSEVQRQGERTCLTS